MLFPRGIRTNNYEYISGKNRLSALFFARNHPNYHHLISFEQRIDQQMPTEILILKSNALVMSRTGRVGHYQSGDAIIEEINKEANDLVGVPTETQWIVA